MVMVELTMKVPFFTTLSMVVFIIMLLTAVTLRKVEFVMVVFTNDTL